MILLNGPPAAGKSTLARRYVDEHDGAALVEVDEFRTTLPNWESDHDTRLVARDLAAAAITEHLRAGLDVVIPQYFGRLGYIELLDAMAREHGATFVEVILATDTANAVERFRARRRAMAERGERHPERDIADGEVEAVIGDAVQRLARLPSARPESLVVSVGDGASEAVVYRRLLAALESIGRNVEP